MNKIAATSIYPEELLTVVVGDSKKLLEQLSEKGFGEINTYEFDDVFNN